MKTTLSFILLFLSVSFAHSQITYNCDPKTCDLFFNLDLDSSKSVIEKQILKIPDFHFITTDKFDTLYLGSGNYYLSQRPTIPGMPCFYSALTSEDQFKPDSLQIFLGGGNGIVMMDHQGNYDAQNSKSYTIETVEILRDFTDINSAAAAYENLRNTLGEWYNVDPFISDWESEGKHYLSFPISLTEEEKRIYQEKRIHLDFYPPSEANNMYTVRLSYAKSIWDSNSI